MRESHAKARFTRGSSLLTPLCSSASVTNPVALALDASGDLFVATSNSNTVLEYAPPYTSGPIATITDGMQRPDGLAFDASGNLWVAMNANSTVLEYAPPFTGAPIASISNGLNSPTELTFALK